MTPILPSLGPTTSRSGASTQSRSGRAPLYAIVRATCVWSVSGRRASQSLERWFSWSWECE